MWRNRILEQQLAEERQSALGKSDVITSTVAQRLDTLEAGLRAVQMHNRNPVDTVSAPVLVNGQWYTVHAVEAAELVPDEGAIYVDEAVDALADVDSVVNCASQDDPSAPPPIQPQYSMGELLAPEALSPFDDFPRATYSDENKDGWLSR